MPQAVEPREPETDTVMDPQPPPGFEPRPVSGRRPSQAASDDSMHGDSASDAGSGTQDIPASEPHSPRGPGSVYMDTPRNQQRDTLLTKMARGEPLRPGGLSGPLTAADTSARASGDRRGLGAGGGQAAPPECADPAMQTPAAWAQRPLARVQQLVAIGKGPHMDRSFYAAAEAALCGPADRELIASCYSYFGADDEASRGQLWIACAVVAVIHPDAWQAPGGIPDMTPPEPVRRTVAALLRTDTRQDGLVGLDNIALASTAAADALRRITAAAAYPADMGLGAAAVTDPHVAATPSARGGASR